MTDQISHLALNKNRKWIPIRKSSSFCGVPNGLSPYVMFRRALEWMAVLDQTDCRRQIGIDLLWASFQSGYALAGLTLAEERSVHQEVDDLTGLTRVDAAQIFAAWAMLGYTSAARNLHFHYADLLSKDAMVTCFSKVKDVDDWFLNTWKLYVNQASNERLET
jgi:hypothetical protein